MNRDIVLDRRDTIIGEGECEECGEFSKDLEQEDDALKCPRCRSNASSGVCEICGQLSDILENTNGSLMCESCKEDSK